MTRLVNNEAPSLAIDNSMDLRLPDAESRTEFCLRPSTARVHLTNLTDVISRQLLGIDTPLGGSVFKIVLCAANKQMGRVDASSDVATVENAQTIMDWANEEFISDPMGRTYNDSLSKATVASLRVYRTDPKPAFRVAQALPDLGEKSCFGRFDVLRSRSTTRIVATTAKRSSARLWLPTLRAKNGGGYTHGVSLVTRLAVPRLFAPARGFSVPSIIPVAQSMAGF